MVSALKSSVADRDYMLTKLSLDELLSLKINFPSALIPKVVHVTCMQYHVKNPQKVSNDGKEMRF